MIPMDWESKALSSLGSPGFPAIKAGPFGSALTKDSYVSEGYKVYGQEQVIRGNCFYGDYFVSKNSFNELRNCAVAPGDILLSLVGTAGRVLVVPDDAPAGIINPRLIRLTFNKKLISPYFFKFVFESEIYQALLSRNAQGGTMGVLNAGLLRPIAIPVPSLREQDAIAEALSDADALIESLDQLIAKKRQVKQGAMQELLTGKRRLPGFSGKWEKRLIEDIADVKTGPFGSALHESDYVPSGTPIITVEHLGEFGVTRQNLPLVSDEDCKRLSAYALKSGDIVFSRVGSVDRNSLISESESGWLFSGRLLRVRVDKDRVFAPYLSFQFHTQSFKQLVLAVAVGQTMASLNTRILKNISVTLPSLAEQTAIATVLSDMDTELAALESRLVKARQIKQGMMQELLTGRIRLL